MGTRLSEREKMYGFMLLFPVFWPFIPVVALCEVLEWAGNKIRTEYWRRKLNAKQER